VRVALKYKFVIGSVIVGAAVVLLPNLLRSSGVVVVPLVSPLIALGAGAAIGFFLSRDLARKFQALGRATENISNGNLTLAGDLVAASRVPDETDDLARSIHTMAASLRELVENVQSTGNRVSSAAQELTRSAQQLDVENSDISTSVASLAGSVAEQQKLLQEANRLIHEISSTIEHRRTRRRTPVSTSRASRSRR